jgi:hypothetical protein
MISEDELQADQLEAMSIHSKAAINATRIGDEKVRERYEKKQPVTMSALVNLGRLALMGANVERIRFQIARGTGRDLF